MIPSSFINDHVSFVIGLNILKHLRTSPEGYAHFTLSGDYYNREFSGKLRSYEFEIAKCLEHSLELCILHEQEAEFGLEAT